MISERDKEENRLQTEPARRSSRRDGERWRQRIPARSEEPRESSWVVDGDPSEGLGAERDEGRASGA